MSLSLDRINKARKAGYDEAAIVESIARNDQEFGKRISKALESGHTHSDVLGSIERKLSSSPEKPDNSSNVKQLYTSPGQNSLDNQQSYVPQSKKSVGEHFISGLQGSTSGQLVGNRPEEITEDPGFWNSLVQESGTLVGDSPYLLAGGTLGAALGGSVGSLAGPPGAAAGALLGGGAGALALPEFLKAALTEYRDYVDKGNDLTFGEFLERADKVASKTLRSGVLGATLGIVSKAAPLLADLPGIGQLFKSKIAQKAAGIGIETATLAGVPAAAKGELPSGRDFASALALVLGFNALKLPKEIRDRIQKEGEASGLPPEAFATSAKAKRLVETILEEGAPSEAKAENKTINAKQQVSGIKGRTSEQTSKANIEPERNTIERREPEKTGKSTEDVIRDLGEVTQQIQDLPKGNKRNLAREALKREQIRTPEQLKLFLDEYESTYEGLPGKTGKDKNRKFLNKYSAKNVEKRNVKPLYNLPIVSVKPSAERTLEIGRTQKREAKHEGNKEKLKEAKKRIDLSKRKLQNEASKKTETPKANVKPLYINTFKTSKGSTYQVSENGSTKRNKAFRPEHGESEQGEQPTSKKTYYLDNDQVNKMSVLATQGAGMRVIKNDNGNIAIQYTTGKNKGKIHASSLIKPKEQPEVGLYPLEIFEDGKHHFGNKIIEVGEEKPKSKSASYSVKPKELSVTKPKEFGSVESIVETTGEGAEERLEPEPSFTGKVKQSAQKVIETAKNPKELGHAVYTYVFDALEPINRLEKDIPVEERVTTKIKQSQNAASDINNVLTQGIFDNMTNTFEESSSLRDVYVSQGNVWQKATKGLKPENYSLREMDVYRTSKEALKRQKKGLKSGIDTAQAEKDVARLRNKYGPVDQRLHEYQTKLVTKYGKDMLGPDGISQWTQESHASLYRAMDYGSDGYVAQGSLKPKKWWHRAVGSGRKILPPSESDALNATMLISNAKKNETILQYRKLVEQGKMPGRIVKSKNKEAPDGFAKDLELDPENKELHDNLYSQSRKDAFTPDSGRLRGWQDGKPFEIEVPEDVYNTFSSMAPTEAGGFTKVLQASSRVFSRGITLDPLTFFSIVTRDATNSLVYSKTGANPFSIFRAIGDIYGDSHSWNQFKSLGGEQYATRLVTRTERIAKIEELIQSESPGATMIKPGKLLDFFRKHYSNLSASVPFAEYQRALKKYGDTPTGRTLALMESKKVSYDPTLKGRGKAIKYAGGVMPFLNVMLQEPLMIAKNITRPMFIAKGMMYYSLPALFFKFLNDGNEDYEALSPVSKAAAYHLYVGDHHFWWPTAWLTGATFKLPAELLYDLVKGEGGEAWKGMYSYIASQLTGTINPLVQAVIEQTTNHSLPNPAQIALQPFVNTEKRAPPVVPRRLENLPPEEQYTNKTSHLARWYGDLTGASPVKVDRLVKTLGGTLASKALALADEVGYATGLIEDKRTEEGASNFLALAKFMGDSTPTYTKYMEEFYAQREKEKLDKQRDKPNNYKELNNYNSRISHKFKEYRSIEQESLDPKVKKQRLKAKQQEINALFKEAVTKHK